MEDGKKFGWSSAIREYSWRSIFEDAIFPFIVSLLFVLSMIFINADSYVFLHTVIESAIDIIPIMLSFILAGYAILLSLYWSDFGSKVKGIADGGKLLNQINSSFAVTLLVMIAGIIVSVVARLIHGLQLRSEYSELINYSVCFIILFISIYSIWIIKDITINIYNLGKASMLI